MDVVVQKFGGTSVATHERRELVADIVANKKNEGACPVVVVSAMGRKGDPYATDTLISLAKGNYEDMELRELDMIMSCGELISSVVVANHFKSKGIKSVALTGEQAGIITDGYFGNATVIRVDPERILSYIEKGFVPVICGFQGVSEYGDFTTLGRGGSDTSASIIGEALKAKSIEIYTDVDGIMTADPRLVDAAKVIPHISYIEVFQFAEQGAKVIHPKAVEVAMRANIPLIIKNTFSDSEGTFITHNQTTSSQFNPNENIIAGVTHMTNRAQVRIEKVGIDDIELFDSLAANRISIDLINVFEDSNVFTVNEKDVPKAVQLFNSKNIKYEIKSNLSKITIVGERMRGVPGVMAKMVRALKKNNISILQSADSNATISCLIKDEDVPNALKALHQEFQLGNE